MELFRSDALFEQMPLQKFITVRSPHDQLGFETPGEADEDDAVNISVDVTGDLADSAVLTSPLRSLRSRLNSRQPSQEMLVAENKLVVSMERVELTEALLSVSSAMHGGAPADPSAASAASEGAAARRESRGQPASAAADDKDDQDMLQLEEGWEMLSTAGKRIPERFTFEHFGDDAAYDSEYEREMAEDEALARALADEGKNLSLGLCLSRPCLLKPRPRPHPRNSAIAKA